MTVTGGKLVLSGKRDLPRRKYGPMTETNEKSVFTGYGSYAARVHTNNYVPMSVTGGNRYSSRINSMRYAYTQITVTGEKTVLSGKGDLPCHRYGPMTVMGGGGEPVLSGKRDPSRCKYGPMTETNVKSVFTGYGSYASRLHTNDCDGGRPVLTI